jgi:hypothetical protein
MNPLHLKAVLDEIVPPHWRTIVSFSQFTKKHEINLTDYFGFTAVGASFANTTEIVFYDVRNRGLGARPQINPIKVDFNAPNSIERLETWLRRLA